MKSSAPDKVTLLSKLLAASHISTENRKLLLRFTLICLFIGSLVLFSSFLVWFLEKGGQGDNTIKSFWDGIWWAIVTIATVGYGDKFPITHAGRIVGLILIIVGFSSLSIFTGLIASLFVEDKLKGAKGLKQIRTTRHIVLCGWNKTAETMLRAMVEKNILETEIVIIANKTPEFFENIESLFPTLRIRFVRGEPTSEEILRRASIATAAQIIIVADQSLSRENADDRTIFITNAVHYLAGKTNITVQLINGENRNLLHRLGIDNIIVSDDLNGYILANNVIEQASLSLFNQLAKDPANFIRTERIEERFIGKKFEELFDYYYLEEKHLVIGLMSKKPDINLESIFTDNTSAIDQFIKNTLQTSRCIRQEDKDNIRWNPAGDSIIQENDHAIFWFRKGL
jgi:voltage-gated potassium channel